MTEKLYEKDAYLVEAEATVIAHTAEGGIVLDKTVFYPTGGGQMGDRGRLGALEIIGTVKGENGAVVLVPAEGAGLPPIGSRQPQVLDWANRHAMMRLHSGLHLLSVVVPLPVTGGQIRAEKARLDFAMPEPLQDKQAVEGIDQGGAHRNFAHDPLHATRNDPVPFLDRSFDQQDDAGNEIGHNGLQAKTDTNRERPGNNGEI